MSIRSLGLMIYGLCLGMAATSSIAIAQPPEDPNHTIIIQLENDSTRPKSDNYYTSGERIAYISPTGRVWAPLESLGHSLLGPGQQRFAFELSQQIFTPYFHGTTNPPLNDRPYAGVLMATAALVQDTDTSRTALALGLGVIGPAALGREVQNGFHDLIGQGDVRGWKTQIPNQPIVQLTAQKVWRMPIASLGPVEVDVLPSISAGAGTFRIYAEAGGTVRIGQGLNSDFGMPRIRPGLTGTDAFVATQPFVWYLFAGVDGQAVAWDETLDGLPFATSRHVSRTPFVGSFHGGITLLTGGFRLTAMQVIQSNDFRTQRNGTFQFSSLSLAVKF